MYQEVCFNRGTEAGEGELMWATRSAPPGHFMPATGLPSLKGCRNVNYCYPDDHAQPQVAQAHYESPEQDYLLGN